MFHTTIRRDARRTRPVCVYACVLIMGFLGCGGSNSSSPTEDASVDAALDAELPDAEPDAEPDTCGNGTIEEDEACDGVELGSATCTVQGLPAGVLACRSDCTLDTSGCAVCDDGICSDAETAVTCPEDCGVVDVTAGATHSCAVLADGTVWCWGAWDGHRMGGTGDVSEPVMLPGIDTAVQVAAGYHHTCVRTVLDEILCWGANGYSETGVDPPSHDVFPPVQVGIGSEVVAGGYHTCIRAPNLETHCWGRVWVGPTSANNPVSFPGGGHLAVGEHHTCYSHLGRIRCFGWNEHGQLGSGGYGWRETAVVIVNAMSATLGSGANHACHSITSGVDAGLYCWGDNEHGQLGRVPGADVLSPEWISLLTPQIIDGGLRHTCAKESVLPGPLLCWGFNARGQLGIGTVTAGFEFRAVDTSEVTSFDSGAEHVCAILTDQTMRCWGDNSRGQIGNGSSDPVVASPAAPTRLGPQ